MQSPASALPLISVLTPCFNASRYVSATIESVLSQDHPFTEMIIVDDGSTDGSASEIERYANDGVRLIRQSHRGAAAARNRALSAARGSFVLFLDADDLIGPKHLSQLLVPIKDRHNEIAFSQWDRFHNAPHEASFPLRSTYVDTDGVSWLVEDWRNAEGMMASGMFLIPMSLLKEVGGWDETLSLSDDFAFYARVISRCTRMHYVSDAYFYYRSGLSDSLSRKNDRRAADSALRAYELGTSYLLSAENSERTRLVSANVFRQFEFRYYPRFPDLRARAATRAAALGGGDLMPDGPPRFHRLRRFVGWRLARRAQLLGDVLRGR